MINNAQKLHIEQIKKYAKMLLFLQMIKNVYFIIINAQKWIKIQKIIKTMKLKIVKKNKKIKVMKKKMKQQKTKQVIK